MIVIIGVINLAFLSLKSINLIALPFFAIVVYLNHRYRGSGGNR